MRRLGNNLGAPPSARTIESEIFYSAGLWSTYVSRGAEELLEQPRWAVDEVVAWDEAEQGTEERGTNSQALIDSGERGVTGGDDGGCLLYTSPSPRD